MVDEDRIAQLLSVLVAAWDRLSDPYNAPGELEAGWWESRIEGAEGELRANGWTGEAIRERLRELRPDIAEDYQPGGEE